MNRYFTIIVLILLASCQNNKIECVEHPFYTNPVIPFDYSDPDAIRVGEDYWMAASSFNAVPGLPILHSKDLINWEIVGYALKNLYSNSSNPNLVSEKSSSKYENFCKVQHGNGVWAPCIRYHQGWFYIYWGDPDFGIYMVKTKNPMGEWEEPVLVKAGKGMIDPSPLWDEDGRAYLVHAWANSRCGFNAVLSMFEMSVDGTHALSDEVMVFDGNEGNNHTVEGAKIYKRNGWYYIFAPAGGVPTGWQIVMRSKNVWGPYEVRKVLDSSANLGEKSLMSSKEASTYMEDMMRKGIKLGDDINGPHQGAWIDTQNGEHWFIHFQEYQNYGRILNLEPMSWTEDDWCVIGYDPDGDQCGEPVRIHPRPNLPWTEKKENDLSNLNDEFNTPNISKQWQWHANPQDWFAMPNGYGFYRMYADNQPFINLWGTPNLLLQKMPVTENGFVVETKLRFASKSDGDAAGLVIMGLDYARAAIRRDGNSAVVELAVCKNAEKKYTAAINSATDNVTINTNIKMCNNPNKLKAQGKNMEDYLEDRFVATSLELKLENSGANPVTYIDIWFKAQENGKGTVSFYYSLDGKNYIEMKIDDNKLGGKENSQFSIREGKWIGAKMGLYCINEQSAHKRGWIDVDWWRVNYL